MENYLKLRQLTAGEPYQNYRIQIWIYIFLLIFEGALRKWFLPGLVTPLLLVRDPIAIWLTMAGLQKGWLKNGYVQVMMIVCTISLLLTILVGHHNFFVAFFGWRIYVFHFPMIFVMGKVLTRNDLIKMGRFILLVSIPMTLLIYQQFLSPQYAWINIGVGGEGSSSYEGAMGYFRPSGTFSFTSGYVAFQSVVGCVMLFYVLMNKSLPKVYQFSNWLLIVIVGCYVVSIPTSISRTHFFQTVVFIAFLAIALLFRRQLMGKFLKFTVMGLIAIAILSYLNIGNKSVAAFTARFETANKIEGGVQGTIQDRYMSGHVNSLFKPNIPVFGYGLGLGTNVGAKMMGGNMYSFGFNAEVEWERIIGECGLIIGFIIIAIRLLFSLKMLQKAYQCLMRRFDLLPWMLSAGMILTIPQAQWSIPTNLGFCVLFGGFTLAAVNTSRNYR